MIRSMQSISEPIGADAEKGGPGFNAKGADYLDGPGEGLFATIKSSVGVAVAVTLVAALLLDLALGGNGCGDEPNQPPNVRLPHPVLGPGR